MLVSGNPSGSTASAPGHTNVREVLSSERSVEQILLLGRPSQIRLGSAEL
jgi:hypothetical protein